MWNASEHGNFGGHGFQQSAAAAGGFLNSSHVTSPYGSQEKKKADRMTNVMACTTAQILQMPDEDDALKIGSMTAKIVTFLGWVRFVEAQSTKLSFLIDDMSGPGIEVQIWIGENEELEQRLRAIREGSYVRVTGAVRSSKGRRHVIAFNISPLKELNEITMHILEVIHTSMAVAVMDKQAAMTQSAPLTAPMPVMQAAGQNFGNTFDSKRGFVPGLTKPQQIVLQSISSCTDESGMGLHDLFNNLKSLNRATIKEAVEFLGNEGHIYSTVDEDHFKSTDSM